MDTLYAAWLCTWYHYLTSRSPNHAQAWLRTGWLIGLAQTPRKVRKDLLLSLHVSFLCSQRSLTSVHPRVCCSAPLDYTSRSMPSLTGMALKKTPSARVPAIEAAPHYASDDEARPSDVSLVGPESTRSPLTLPPPLLPACCLPAQLHSRPPKRTAGHFVATSDALRV